MIRNKYRKISINSFKIKKQNNKKDYTCPNSITNSNTHSVSKPITTTHTISYAYAYIDSNSNSLINSYSTLNYSDQSTVPIS
jgi:hypothetical protein